MPLSEEELRLLEQMERALVAEDPKFASTLRGTSLQSVARRRVILAGIGLLAGIAVLMGGAISGIWPVGIVGFVIMLAAATYGLGAARAQRTGTAPSSPVSHPSGFGVIDGGRSGRRHQRAGRGSHTFMSRLEDRWRRRRDQRGY